MSSLKALLNTRKNMFDERDEAGNIPLQTLGLRIPAPMHQALKVRVAEQGVTMTAAIQEAISDYLDKTNPANNALNSI